ncbi:hypothetical protein GCM10010124_39640 [Pilimelia terevasa]|uniref:Uncharacterized protein n=1 Tax=Pilimelia terevasa TaxID=53372 RepID=A0A8J3BS37_9ACTN|nr:hypothetical protein GCM10010124_39640 [Pilimelia terevasa]
MVRPSGYIEHSPKSKRKPVPLPDVVVNILKERQAVVEAATGSAYVYDARRATLADNFRDACFTYGRRC